MMIFDNNKFSACAGASLALALAFPRILPAQEAAAAESPAPAQQAAGIDPELKAEIAYVEALIDAGLPDFAEPVMATTKAKWPEAETLFFAFEVRSLLLLNKFDEADAKIAALPDRKSSKYWAARLEVANSHFNRGKTEECAKIYEEFFKNNQKPAKDLVEFVRNAYFQWGQLLIQNKRFLDAADNYAKLLAMIDPKASDEDEDRWYDMACEAAELYLRVAKGEKDKKKLADHLNKAKGIIKQLLWCSDRPVVFGRAIAMKANAELLGGSVQKAQATIDDYMDQLADLHAQLVEKDPDGRLGALRLSPMPLCRYMLAEMQWNEAKTEAKKPNRDDERIKSLMFGDRKKNGQRNGSGAFNHALNVFIKYPMSAWASQAGDMSKEIAAFAEKEYGAKIQTNITPEQEAKVRQMQFKNANEKFAERDFKGAIDEYFVALSNFPEGRESIPAIENLANCYQGLILRSKDPKEKDELRIFADAVEGYLAERFSGSQDKIVMISAGDAVVRIAGKEKAMGNSAGADKLHKAFLSNYRRHSTAATMAVSMAGEAMAAKRYREAIELYKIVDKYYKKSSFYATSLSNLGTCYNKIGERQAAIETFTRYLDVEKNALRRLQVQANLAQMYQKDGLAILENAGTNTLAEAAEAEYKRGTAQIIRGIKECLKAAGEAKTKLADPGISAKDKQSYSRLRETSLYLAGDCYSRISKPEAYVEKCRRDAVKTFEEYVAEFPRGQFAKFAYVKLGTVYTVLNEVEKCKEALSRLRKAFPESEEAKKAMPRLARNLIEFARTLPDEAKKEALKRESTDIYAEMIRSENVDYTAHDFVRAGESLIEAKGWALADEAFDKAIAKAATNQTTLVARARLGKAQSLMAQRNWADAREYLDQFMADEKMSRLGICTNACDMIVQCATEQGSKEPDETLRRKHYGAAIGAVKKLRNYWKNEPVWKQDQVDLMSADVRISQAEAETAMGLDEAAAKTRGVVATTLQTFLQTRAPTAERTIDQYSQEEQDNLEEAYAKLLPILLKMGKAQADRTLKFATEYLTYFPNGKYIESVRRCKNEALALGGKLTAETEAAEPAQEQAEEE